MMARYFIVGLVFVAALSGCARKPKSPPPPEPTPEEMRANLEKYARAQAPILDRTIIMQELEQIHLYLYTAYSASGKWPKDLDAAKDMMRRDADMRKLLAKIDDGTYVVVGNPPEGGIVAYCTKETTMGLVSVSTGKDFNFHKPDDLQKILQQQRR